MEIIQFEPEDKINREKFIKLPFTLYDHTPQWVPPLEMDILRIFNRKSFPFYQHSEATFFIFNRKNQTIGRLAVLNHKRYNNYNNQKTAFFYLFECIDDQEAAQELFSHAFKWAKDQGLDHMIGPKGFTVFDGLGLLIEGFQYRPAFGIPYNHQYYESLITSLGFSPLRDLVSGYLDENFKMPSKITEIAELLKIRRGLTVTTFKNKKELRKKLIYLKDLYNSALHSVGGNPPITDEEIKSLLNQLLWFADPRLIKFVMKDNKPIGFLLAYPDISEALQKTKGKLFPFGWIESLLELQRTKWMNINGAGIVEGYRGIGGTALLFTEMLNSVIETRYRFADIVQIGTENEKMQRELRELGIDFYKTHRVYSRILE